MTNVLLQLPDAADWAVRDGLIPGNVGDPQSYNLTNWNKIRDGVGFNLQTTNGTRFITTSDATRALVAQMPALSALWAARDLVAQEDQGLSAGDLQNRLPLYLDALHLTDTQAALFGSSWNRYIGQLVAARDAWIANLPNVNAWTKAQQDFQAAAARGTIGVGNGLDWPTEYVMERTTLPDGKMYAVIYDPRNTDIPDGISVRWWEGPTFKPLTTNPANGHVKINNSVFEIPDAGTGPWYVSSWAGVYCVPPVGWVNDHGALISPRAKNSLMLPSTGQQVVLIPNLPPASPVPTSPVGGTAPTTAQPGQPVLLTPAGSNGTSEPANASSQAAAAMPSVAGFTTVGAIVVGGIVLYLLTRGES